MDADMFDHITRGLIRPHSRRGAMSFVAGGLLGSVGLASSFDASGKKKKKRKKKVALCLNDQTISVPKKQQGTFLGVGATTGACPGGGDPDPECIVAEDCDSFLCVDSTCETCSVDPDCGRDWAGSCYCKATTGQCYSVDNSDLVRGGCQNCPPERLGCFNYEEDYWQCQMPCGWKPA